MSKPIALVVVLIALNLFFGVFTGVVSLNPYIAVVMGLSYFVIHNVLIFEWCEVNSQSKGLFVPAGAKTLTVLFAPVGLAYYFFRVYKFYPALAAYLVSLVVIAIVALSPGIPVILWGTT